ncbi:DUF3422 family protein [Undibacterium sp. SXout20W]|uniref:DUF3422 family protein n=1 Tax=Undibacterium sp. SXout20W TaxID=3413051 RepID=UPI003BF2B9FC
MNFNFSDLNNALRVPLAAEVHSRPFMPLLAPECLTHLAVYSKSASSELTEHQLVQHELLVNLCSYFGVVAPGLGAKYFYHDFGRFRLKWELHTEFSTYTFASKPDVNVDMVAAFDHMPIEMIPHEWLARLSGQIMVGAHVVLHAGSAQDEQMQLKLQSLFGKSMFVGSQVLSGGEVWTDFIIHPDGFSRFVLCDVQFTEHQASRMIQRVLEIETYRMMALLGLPNAQKSAPELNIIEAELSTLCETMVNGNQSSTTEPGLDVDGEQILLQKIIALAARLEAIALENNYRFSASLAYFKLVRTRIEELREKNIHGMPSIGEFMDRRLVPAMNTCESVGRRQVSLAERIAQTNDLLRTRVGIVQEQQNRQILQSLSKRAAQQVLLQQSVEGLSVVAISYYMSGLLGYLGKALKAAGLPVNPDVVTGVALPVIVVGVWLGLRRLHKKISHRLHA